MSTPEDAEKDIRHAITHYLSRREHGYHELIQKLSQKGFTSNDIVPILDKFKDADIQSDVRFADMHIRNGANKGQGMTRIKETLRQLRVDDASLNLALQDVDIDWFSLAQRARLKRFGELLPSDTRQKSKQQRFLLYRGFSFEQIDHALTNTVDP